MAISDVSLTAGMRSNLLDLQSTAKLLDRTQTRLSTGKKVNTALDDPVSFFKAQSYMNRASDLSGLKDGMANAIQTVKAADNGIKGITTLINSAKSIAAAAATTTGTAAIDALAAQYDTIRAQIATLASDSGFGGLNLLNAENLVVTFDPAGSNVLTVNLGSTSTGVGNIAGQAVTAAGDTWRLAGGAAASSVISTDIAQLDGALTALRSQSSSASSNLAIISARQDFTSSMISTLQTGADNLTLADMNEEGANMLMLQTRQSLGTTALGLSSQAAQSVLRLFG